MFRRSILIRNVSLRRMSTVDKGANKGSESSSAMQNFMQNASQRQEGGSTPLWNRLVRDLTPPSKPENVNASKDRREFNRNRPVNERSRGQGRYGTAAAKKSEPKVAAGSSLWQQGDDSAGDGDEDTDNVAPSGRLGGFGDDEGDDLDEYGYDDDRDEDDIYRLRASDRSLTSSTSDVDVDDPKFVDDKDYDDLLNLNGEAVLSKWDFTLHYEEGAKSGMYLKKRRKRSPFIHMMKNALFESYKTSTGTYLDAFKLSSFERTIIPKPRSVRKLLFVQMPNIRQAGPETTPGYKNAEAAWSVVHKNVYYSEAQKYFVCEEIGTRTNEVYAYINQGPLSNTYEAPNQAYDPVFRFGFKKGLRVIEDEEREAALRETRKQATKKYIQGDTDWAQETVDDEDAL